MNKKDILDKLQIKLKLIIKVKRHKMWRKKGELYLAQNIIMKLYSVLLVLTCPQKMLRCFKKKKYCEQRQLIKLALDVSTFIKK